MFQSNVANVNTVGYKPSRASFSDLLYTQMWTNTDALVNAASDAGAQDTADENGVGGMTDADLYPYAGAWRAPCIFGFGISPGQSAANGASA